MAPEPAGARRNAARAPVDTDQLLPLTVEVAHAFGSHCGRGFHDAVLFGDIAGQYLVHPVGRYMAFRHLVGGEASYTVESDKVQAVTACAVSRDRSLLVTCEICSLPAPHSQVSIYNLGTSASTRPTQTLEELGEGVGRIVAAAFSAATDQDAASSLLCLASEGPPEPQILVLDWHLNQVLGRFSLSSAVSRVAFSPASSGIVSASGPECLNLWVLRDRPQETQQEPEGSQELPVEVLGKKELCKLSEVSSFKGVPLTFTDHAWLEPANGNLVVCTEEGPVHIVRIEVVADVSDGAADPTPYLLCTIELPFGSLLETASLCVRCIANGFMVGGGSGALALWSLSAPGPGLQAVHGEDYGEDSDEVYDEDESPAPVYCLDTCVRVTGAAGHGSALLCLDVVGDSDEAQILLGFQSADITCLSLSELRATAPVGEVVGCSPISGGFHSGPITSLDMAVQRPILVSACKEDSTVRVWDYQAGHCDLRTEFAGEEITGVAVHPFGFFLAISFSDRIRFMQILAKELKPFRELLVRGLRCVRFSNGGHLVAAVQSKLVVVWNTRTLKKLQTLKGHPSQVSSISFDPDDKLLMTCGEDGSLCEWSTLSWTKVHEQPSRGEASAAAAGRDGFGWAGIVEGGNSAFRSFRRCNAREDEDIVLPTGTRLCAMSYHSSGTETANSEDYVLAGDSWGALRTFCSLSAIMRIKEHGLHSAACTAVCVSTDSRTVATAGEDGAIFVLRVDGLVTPTAASSAVGPARAGRNGGGSMEVVMINRGEIQQRQDEIEELTNETGGLKAQLEEDAARLQNECRVRVDEARRKDQEQVQSLRLKYEALQQASTAKERENLRQMKAMEASHLQAADELEKVYDKKVRSDADSYSSLEVELRELGVKLEQARETAQRTLEQQRAKQEQEIARQAAEKDAEIKKIKDLMAFTQHRFDAMLDQEGGEQDMEMTDITRRSQEELEQQHLVEYKLKKEQDTLLRGLDMIEKDRERIATEQREAVLVVNGLKSEADQMQRSVAVLKAERRDREATLRDKEVEIGAHKLKVQTLKKFKHVLDYRLREVTESLQPKEQMIQQLHMQLHILEEEFEKQLEIQKQMEITLDSKSQQVSSLTAEEEKLKGVLKQREATIFNFTTDLHALATTDSDTRQWHVGLKKIWRDHVDPEVFNKEEGSILPMNELGRQIQVMGRKADVLAARGESAAVTCQSDIIQKTQENSLLIQEADELRVEKKALMRQLKDLELRVRQGEQKLAAEATLALTAGASGPSNPSNAGRSRLPKEVTDFFDEAPMALQRFIPRASLKKDTSKMSAHLSEQERQGAKSLLRVAESNQEKVQMQKIEQKLLNDQLVSLQKEKMLSSSGAAAGAGLSAVRKASAEKGHGP